MVPWRSRLTVVDSKLQMAQLSIETVAKTNHFGIVHLEVPPP